MCMLAAYLGTQSASAPLLKMLKRQETILGGFYSGIVTCQQEQLSCKKVVGSAKTLEQSLSLDALPGRVGIAHSRTNDGGDSSWAQPQISQDGSLAWMGMGIGGVLAEFETLGDLAQKLTAEGIEFRTRSPGEKGNGIALPDGNVVQPAEVLSNAYAELYRKGCTIPQALRKLNQRAEAVFILLSAREPDRIFVANHNQSLVVSRNDDAILLASTTLAFEHKPRWISEIPPNSIAVVSLDGVAIETLWDDEDRYDFSRPSDAGAAFCRYLREHPDSTFPDVVEGALKPLLAEDRATQVFPLGHRLLETLLAEDKVSYTIEEVSGAAEGLRTPQMKLRSKV